MTIEYPCGCTRVIEGSDLESRAKRLANRCPNGCYSAIAASVATNWAKAIWNDEDGQITLESVPADLRDEVSAELAAKERKNAEWVKSVDDAFAPRTANGVVYGSASEAGLVRAALKAEGIPHHYPGTREAKAALRKHGVIRTPKVGERWGCGSEQGVIVRFTADSRAIIRLDIGDAYPHGIERARIGRETDVAIHVLSPATVPSGGNYIG